MISVNFTKAFDHFRWEAILNSMKLMGFDEMARKLIKQVPQLHLSPP